MTTDKVSLHPFHFTIGQGQTAPITPGLRSAQLFEYGSMKIRYYAPKSVDNQTPHEQDELYVIISGQGRFQNGDKYHAFQPGDVIFVPAEQEHRFIDFSEDFATWVIFYGPEGGETE